MEQAEKKKHSYTRYLGYGIGAIGMDLSYGLFNSFLNNYFTDVLLINSMFIGVISFLARLWDGVNDPMMGTIVDNTRTRIGKFRPWILTGAFLNAVVLVLLFTNPGFSIVKGTLNIGLYAYVAIMYVLWGMTYTIMDIPYWSMVPALTIDPTERNMVATIPRFFSGAGQIIVVVMTVQMVKMLGAGDEQMGYTWWAVICAVLLVAVCAVTFFTTKEKTMPMPESKEKFTLGKAFRTVKKNDQLLIFILTAICFNTGWYLTNGLGIYYFDSVLENKDLYAVFGVIGGLGQALGLILLPVLTKRFGRNQVIKGAMVLTIFGYLGMFLTGPVLNIFPLFAVLGVLGCMGVGCMFVAETIMLADIVDYGEYKLGYRTDSIVFSMKSLLLKAAYSIQTLILNAGLWISKYDGELVHQSDMAKGTINVMMFIIPPVFVLLSLIIFSRKYKLDAKKMEEVTAHITEKHERELELERLEKSGGAQ